MPVAFIGLVFDGGRIYFEQRRMQITAGAERSEAHTQRWIAESAFALGRHETAERLHDDWKLKRRRSRVT